MKARDLVKSIVGLVAVMLGIFLLYYGLYFYDTPTKVMFIEIVALSILVGGVYMIRTSNLPK